MGFLRKGILATVLCLVNALAYANIPPFDAIKYQLAAPSAELRAKVSLAWNLMYPLQGIEPDYKKALELNQEAFNQGHPEGASNIGLMYEYGLGVEKDNWTAAKWYLKAESYEFHSPQAELGLARVSMQRAPTKENLDTANMYIEAARVNARNRKSLWYDQRLEFLKEAELLQRELDHMR